jgi:ferric-dicitrate binding protein FerR (iron transport regulator)
MAWERQIQGSTMRAVLAATLVLLLAAAVAVPHVHAAPSSEECAACVARGGEVAESQVPDLSPLQLAAGDAVLAPQSRPGDGAPLGAIPGQSPPRA